MGNHAFLADTSISIFGAFGAVIVLCNLKHITPTEAVARPVRFCLWVLIILLVARVGHWGELGWLFSMLTQATAAFIPLSGLLIAEVLLRRHAPPILKWFCGLGAVVFVIFAMLSLGQFGYLHILGLLTFQVIGLTGIAILIVTRDRASLALVENQAIGRISLAFVFILPFLVTDFLRTPNVDIPVRLGGVAVLALCWLLINFQRSGLSRADIMRGLSAVFGISMVLAVLMALAVPLEWRSGAQITAVLLAAFMLLATWQAAVALHIEDTPMAALRAMTEVTGSGPEAGLILLRRASGSPDAVAIGEAELGDFNGTVLAQAFKHNNIRHIGESAVSEDISWLLASYGATHAVRLTDAPFSLVLLNNPALSMSDGNDMGLAAVVRMARIISKETAA